MAVTSTAVDATSSFVKSLSPFVELPSLGTEKTVKKIKEATSLDPLDSVFLNTNIFDHRRSFNNSLEAPIEAPIKQNSLSEVGAVKTVEFWPIKFFTGFTAAGNSPF